MRITEERLKQLIAEEIIDRLIEKEVERFRKALREECKKQGLLLTEQQEEDEIDLYKKQSRRDFLRKLGKWGMGAAAAGALSGPLVAALDTAADEREEQRISRNIEIADYKESDQYIMDELTIDLTNPVVFSWTWGADKGSMQSPGETQGKVSQPENFPLLLDKRYGQIGILSPEYGVVRKLYDDLQAQMGEDLDKKTTDLTPSVTKEVAGDGTAAQWKSIFPEIYKLPRKPNFRKPQSGVLQQAYRVGFKGDVAVSPHYDGMIYLPYEAMLPEMVMPNSQRTPSEYYMDLWDKYVVKRAKK